MKLKVMGLNPGYLLKSFLLYQLKKFVLVVSWLRKYYVDQQKRVVMEVGIDWKILVWNIYELSGNLSLKQAQKGFHSMIASLQLNNLAT